MSTKGAPRFLALFQLAVLTFGTVYTSPSVDGRVGRMQSRSEASLATPQIQIDPAIGRKMHVQGVRNLGQVTPTLFRGGQPTPEGWRNLANMGIDIVVDLRLTRRAHERAEVTKLGMRYIELPWECFHPTDADITRFFDVLRQNPGKKIYVHCFTGDDRTGMEIAAYRMAEQGWTAQQAREEMSAFGFNFFHSRICPRLGAYETRFPERLATSPAFEDLRAQAVPPNPAQTR